MLGPSIDTAVSRTTAPAAQRSCTLSGHVFSDEQHHLLRAVARTRGWPGAIWVPARVVKLLQLPLRDTRFAPVRVDTDLDHALMYHSAQFVLPLAAMQARWHDHLRRSEEAEQTRLSGLLSAQTSVGALPLNTSGERFEEATEERILRHARHVSPGASRYWTTAAEAAYLYAAPFSATYLADPANAVVTDANPLYRPLRLYNAAGTGKSHRFSPETCRRYDAINAYGKLYLPATAVRMKAFAIRHGCLHEPRWITPRRARALGSAMPPHVHPPIFHTLNELALINVALTWTTASHADAAPQAPPAAEEAECGAVSEEQLEEALLVPRDTALIEARLPAPPSAYSP